MTAFLWACGASQLVGLGVACVGLRMDSSKGAVVGVVGGALAWCAYFAALAWGRV